MEMKSYKWEPSLGARLDSNERDTKVRKYGRHAGKKRVKMLYLPCQQNKRVRIE